MFSLMWLYWYATFLAPCLAQGHGHAHAHAGHTSGAEALAQQESSSGVGASDVTPAHNDGVFAVVTSRTILRIFITAALIGSVYYASRVIAKISAAFSGVVKAVREVGGRVIAEIRNNAVILGMVAAVLVTIRIGAQYDFAAHLPQILPVPAENFVTCDQVCGDWTDSNGRLYQYCVLSQNSGLETGCTMTEASNIPQAIIDTVNKYDPNGSAYRCMQIESSRFRRSYVQYARWDTEFYGSKKKCP